MPFIPVTHLLASRRQMFRGAAGAGAAAALAFASSRAEAFTPPHLATSPAAWRGLESVSLGDRPLAAGEAGRLAALDLDELPLLSDIVLNIQRLAPGSAREPHWHAYHSELNCVLEGQGEMGIVGLDGKLSRFPLTPGTVSFVPHGLTHYIANTGKAELVMAIGFNGTQAQTSALSNALAAFGADRLAQVTGLSADEITRPATQEGAIYTAFGTLAAPATPSRIVDGKPVSAAFPDKASFANDFGVARDVGLDAIPHLDGLAMTMMTLEPGAMRDIHWHPKGTELVYVIAGELEWGLQAPGKAGDSSVFTAGTGHAVAIPEGWLHYAANTGKETARLLVLWGTAAPKSIELSGVLAALPTEITAASAGAMFKPETAAALARISPHIISGAVKG